MLDPNYLLHISEGAENISEQLHTEILKRIISRIMIRIGRGDDYVLTAQDKWQIENLQQAGYLIEDIQKDIAKAARLQQSEIAEAMEEAGVKALDYDDKVYKAAGLSTKPLLQSPELIRLMQRNYEATMGEWTNFTRTMADESQKIFISQLDNAYNLVSTGALSYTQAVREVINNIASNGVVVIYPSGHTDTIETATLRAVRTGISQASANIQIARMDELDVDLVITSSHLGARPLHQTWQGKVYSRSGKNGKYPDFVQETGYGTVSGLCGANCRHNFSPWFEGMDNPFEQYDSEENLKQYKKEQYQRKLERRIRNTKREVMAKKEAVDSCKDEKLKFELDMEYQKKAFLLEKQNKAYNEYCDENGLRPLSDRIQIAKWDRKQAAAARGAAKRYDSARNVVDNKKEDALEKGVKSSKITIDESIVFRNAERGDYNRLSKLHAKNTSKEDAAQIMSHNNTDGTNGGYVATNNYQTINSNMRKDGFIANKLDEDDLKTIDTLRKVISQNTLDDDYYLTRYVNADYLTSVFGVKFNPHGKGEEAIGNSIVWANNYRKFIPKITEEMQKWVGKELVEKAFVSTSLIENKNIMKEKPVMILIEAPKGTNCFIPKNRKESECILSDNTRLFIRSIEFNPTDNKWIINVRYMGVKRE